MSRAYRSDCWDSVNHLTRYWEVWERRCVKSARGKGRNGNVETKNARMWVGCVKYASMGTWKDLSGARSPLQTKR